jgi:hypothetical protein
VLCQVTLCRNTYDRSMKGAFCTVDKMERGALLWRMGQAFLYRRLPFLAFFEGQIQPKTLKTACNLNYV